MHPFDMNGTTYRTEAVSAKKLPRRTVMAILGCFLILIIGLIVAIGFAIAGYTRKLSDGACPDNPVVWQDVACCRKACKKNWDPTPLLLISLDGFRYDYLQRNKTPTLKRLIDCGVHAPFMFPSYPTKTFPNHYSIITGLYPESHGIIDNSMYDPTITPEKDRLFRMESSSSKNPQWWRGEPFWNTVMKNGMRAATYFWPGSEVVIQNMKPNYTLSYDKGSQFYGRVDQVVNWLLLPENERPAFLTMYFDQPDTDGHAYGPDSPQVTNTLLATDAQINYLMTRLLEEDLLHCINIVILADHGMQKVQQLITLDSYLPTQNLAVFGGPIARIAVGNSSFTPEQIREDVMCKNTSYRAYLRQDMPRRTHYSNNPRIGDVVLDGDAGVEILGSAPAEFLKHGDHGYDNKVDTMHALFLAWGPSYKQNYTVAPFQNIELYNFFADTLKLETRASTNGTLGVLDEIFITPPERKGPEAQSKSISACTLKKKSCGTCTEKAPTACAPMSADKLVTAALNQTLCTRAVCSAAVVYNADFQLPTAVFGEADGKITSTGTSETCTQIAYSDLDCSKIASIQAALSSANLTMAPINTWGNSSDGKGTSDSDGWELKAPMHNGFASGIWKYLGGLTHDYAQTYGPIAVISGPIFDYDNNGLADDVAVARAGSSKRYSFSDILVPSHYYRILVRCTEAAMDNCMDPRPYLQMHMARVRDIELLTGLEFFMSTGLEQGQLHRSILHRTNITEDLW